MKLMVPLLKQDLSNEMKYAYMKINVFIQKLWLGKIMCIIKCVTLLSIPAENNVKLISYFILSNFQCLVKIFNAKINLHEVHKIYRNCFKSKTLKRAGTLFMQQKHDIQVNSSYMLRHLEIHSF